MNISRKSLLVLTCGFITLVLAACDRPFEKAGRAVDKTGDAVKEAVK